MKKYIAICISMCLLSFGYLIQAQNPGCLFDTIRFEITGTEVYQFDLTDNSPKTFVVKNMELVAIPSFSHSIKINSGLNYCNLFRERAIEMKNDDLYLPHGKIANRQTGYEDVFFYCPGAFVTESFEEGNIFKRVSDESRIVCLGKGTVSYVLGSGEEVARFCLIREPCLKNYFDQWFSSVNAYAASLSKVRFPADTDFFLLGQCSEKTCLIFYSSENDLFYLFENNDLKALFAPPRERLFAPKNKRLQSRLLINQTLPHGERVQILRFTILCLWIRAVVVPADFYGI